MPPKNVAPDDEPELSEDSSDFSRLDSATLGKIPAQISDLLHEAGIPVNRQRAHVGRILNISYQASRRLMLGVTPWTDEEITAVLASIDLVWSGLAVAHKNDVQTKRTGLITIEGLEMVCDVFEHPRQLPVPPAADALCLANASDAVALVVRSTANVNRDDLRMIKSIQINPIYARTGPLLAILDDNLGVVQTLMQALSSAGFRTEAFTSPQDLAQRALTTPPLDAYLLDWTLRDGDNIGYYIPTLRKSSPDAAMVVLRGHFDSGFIDPATRKLSDDYNLTLMSKPASTAAIVQNLLALMKHGR